MNKKVLFAVLGIFLMTSGIFSVISYIPAPSTGILASPDLTSIGETGSVSSSVSYWTQSSVSNSGTSTIYLPVSSNSSQSSIDFSASQLSISSGTATGSVNVGSFYYYDGTTIGGTGIILPLPTYNGGTPTHPEYYATVGTVTVELSVNGATDSWSYTFNSDGGGSPDPSGYIEVFPSWSLSNSYSGSFTLSFTITSDSNAMTTFANSYQTSSQQAVPISYSGSSNSVVINPSSEPSQASQSFVYGWFFNPGTATFTIPQYESAFDVSWTSSSSSNPNYNSQSQTGTSGTLTGSLTGNSVTVKPVGDPDDVSGTSSTYSFSYNLSRQSQVSSASATQTSSPTYTYTQVSGTTNQASASFGFSGTTPSTAVFEAYESSQNSLKTDSTSITFTPTITLL